MHGLGFVSVTIVELAGPGLDWEGGGPQLLELRAKTHPEGVRGARVSTHMQTCQPKCPNGDFPHSIRGAGVTMKDFGAFLDTGRCKNWAHKIFP